jgi:RimJ/RimL family protein N-acetyltransferase
MEVVFTSERLIFRKFTEDDDNLIYELDKDPEVTKYWGGKPIARESAKEILVQTILPQYKNYNYGRWAVHLKTTHTFIGWCGLKYRPELNKIDLGYRLMRMYWNKGYATEAAKRTIEFGFKNLHLQEIFAAAHIDNIASINVLKKCGMQYVGVDIIDTIPVKTYILQKDI